MLPKQNRLNKKSDLEKVFKEGRSFKNSTFVLRFTKNNLKNPARFGIIVSGKVSKKAVIRNKIKRRIRAVIRELLVKIKPGTWVVLIAQDLAAQKSFQEIKEQLINLFYKAKILKWKL